MNVVGGDTTKQAQVVKIKKESLPRKEDGHQGVSQRRPALGTDREGFSANAGEKAIMNLC